MLLGSSSIAWSQDIEVIIYVDNHSEWVCIQVDDLDCIMAAVGGGGMISGICVAAKVTVIIIVYYLLLYIL